MKHHVTISLGSWTVGNCTIEQHSSLHIIIISEYCGNIEYWLLSNNMKTSPKHLFDLRYIDRHKFNCIVLKIVWFRRPEYCLTDWHVRPIILLICLLSCSFFGHKYGQCVWTSDSEVNVTQYISNIKMPEIMV